MTKHGMCTSPEYRAWQRMKQRCYWKKGFAYSYYGGRGIKVCDRWLNSFENFYADMGDRPSPELSLDRIDSNGNYEPSNCRWATRSQQSRNSRPSVRNKSGKTGVYWCEKEGKWKAQMALGTFTDLQEAIKIREKAERWVYGDPDELMKTAMLRLIGDKEEWLENASSVRNDFRAELREKIEEYFK